LNPIIFIDTNIFLDFYRIRNSEVSLSFLEQIKKHGSIIVTSSQVEMEFKKNRQKVILESLGKMKQPDWAGLTPPAFLSNAKPVDLVNKAKDSISKNTEKIRQRILSVLETPSRSDKVYQALQGLFKSNNEFNLSRNNKARYSIRRAAWKRFMLGYPPRKSDDVSIGDAVNWEWIVHCAQNSTRDVAIVSRDNDYGVSLKSKSILNDWLTQEFKERVSRKRNIVLTDKLSIAFKLASIPVSKKAEEAEEKLINESLEGVKSDSVGSRSKNINDLVNSIRIAMSDYKMKHQPPSEG
jgi:predicted nucleic acid-binding protein